jgi:hypothetical protein
MSTNGNVAFHELTGTALMLWRSAGIATGSQIADLEKVLDYLRETAQRAHLASLGEVVTAANLDPGFLAPPTDAPTAVDETESYSGSHAIHRRRNLLAAVCCTDALITGAARGGLLPEVAPLPRRTTLASGRPLYDDERVLLRLIVTDALRRDRPHHLAVAKYVLTEAGCTPGEATAIFLSDIGQPRHPTFVEAPGNDYRSPRRLPLDQWQSEALGVVAATQAAHGAIEKPLAYHGDGHQPGSSQANMSCHRSLITILSHAGLWSKTEVTASSITYSAADRVERAEGPTAAIHLLGLDEVSLDKREARAARDLRRTGTQPTVGEEHVVRSFLLQPFSAYDPPARPTRGRRSAGNHPRPDAA